MAWYDPAIAANIISVLAMIVAAMSYRLTKKAEASKKDATLPDVNSVSNPVEGQDGWHHIYIKIRNNFSTDLYLTGATFRRPRKVVGISESDASQQSSSGSFELKTTLPISLARRKIELDMLIAPAGTARHQYGLHPGSVEWVSLYVLADPSTTILFDLEFSLRRTEVRRNDKHISHQRVMIR